MIVTARSIISVALRHIAAVASGDTVDSQEMTDCFGLLNGMIDSWNIESLMSTNIDTGEAVFPAGTTQITFGPLGDIVTADVPNYINYVFINGLATAVVKDRETFDNATAAAQSGLPIMAFHHREVPVSVLLLSSALPLESTIKVGFNSISSQFADLDTEVEVVPGVKRTMEYNLALEIAPMFEKQPSQIVMQNAIDSKANMKTVNYSVPVLTMPPEWGRIGVDIFDIRSGE